MSYRRVITVILVFLLTLFAVPINASADEPSTTIDPKQTNELYEGLIDGLNKSDFSDELKKIDFDNSMAWSVYGWSRAWLITSLCLDLKDNDESLYDTYAKRASKFYIALIPPMFNRDDPYSYQVLLLDGTNALMFYYTPGSKYCTYREQTNITQKNVENLSTLASIVWEVTEEDFDSMNDVIEIEKASLTGNISPTSPKPTATPSPVFTRSEIENEAASSLVIMLMIDKKYSRYDIDATQYRIDSVITVNDGWDVKGTAVLYDYRYTPSVHTFRVHVDSNGKAGACTISKN